MSLERHIREDRPHPEAGSARFGHRVEIEWIQPREPYGGWVSCEAFQPEEVQACLSIGRLIHDDDCIKVLAGSSATRSG